MKGLFGGNYKDIIIIDQKSKATYIDITCWKVEMDMYEARPVQLQDLCFPQHSGPDLGASHVCSALQDSWALSHFLAKEQWQLVSSPGS